MDSGIYKAEEVLADILSINSEIIEKQNIIKNTAENLRSENDVLQSKTKDLQNILQDSQKSLQSETSIPLQTLNKTVADVNRIKTNQKQQMEILVSLVKESSEQFIEMQGKVKNLLTSSEESSENILDHQAPASRLVKQILLCPIV